MVIHAIDPETKHWICAKILEIDNHTNEVKVTWPGYGKSYDCWVSFKCIRHPVEIRSLLNRNSIQKENFPNRKAPKNLLEGDSVYDKGRNKKFVVNVNDLFKAQVIYF